MNLLKYVFLLLLNVSHQVMAADRVDLEKYEIDISKLSAEFYDIVNMLNGDFKDPPFLDLFSFKKAQDNFSELDTQRKKLEALIKGQEEAHPELLSLLTTLKNYKRQLTNAKSFAPLSQFEDQLNKFEQVVVDQVKKLEESIAAIMLIVERSSDSHWGHLLKADSDNCRYCSGELNSAAFWCMSCEKKFCHNCENKMSLPKHLCYQKIKAQICPGCSYSYTQNKMFYEANHSASRCKDMQRTLEQTKIEGRHAIEVLLLRKQLLKEVELLSVDIQDFAGQYLLSCDKLLSILKARMALLSIIKQAATSNESLWPALGVLANGILEKVSQYFPLALPSIDLAYLSIAAVNFLAIGQQPECLAKFALAGSCQLLAYSATRKSSSVIITMVVTWAASALAQMGYEVFYEKDQMAIRVFKGPCSGRWCIVS